MSRIRIIAVTGIALLAGLALIENATRSVHVLPATVAAITAASPEAGPDQWTVTARLSEDETVTLTARTARPSLVEGDAICVRLHKRSWAAAKYQLASDTTC